jgi:hypothetical protein
MRNSKSVTPEEGARCAQLIRDTLIHQVILDGSPFSGLLFDVRKGPPVFGPKTRGQLEALFSRAGNLDFKTAVLVSENPTQRLQFGNLAAECAPECCRIVFDETEVHSYFD